MLLNARVFTFEPHISIPDSKYGYKREDIYYFEVGKLIKLQTAQLSVFVIYWLYLFKEGKPIMKTLILNGSPRANGDTSSLVEKLINALEGDSYIANAYRCNISPCIDCRYCWENDACKICDEMQEVYSYIQICDNIVIVSPFIFQN